MGKEKSVNEQLSARVDALEIALLMLLNSLQDIRSFSLGNKDYQVIRRIPKTTLKMIEKIIIKN